MIIKLDFTLSAWVKELLIDAESELDALNKLNSMTLAELIDAGARVDPELEIRDARTEVIQQDFKVRVTKVKYNFAIEKLDPAVADYLAARLPSEFTLNIKGVTNDDDIEELIKNEIYAITDHEVDFMLYEILETI